MSWFPATKVHRFQAKTIIGTLFKHDNVRAKTVNFLTVKWTSKVIVEIGHRRQNKWRSKSKLKKIVRQ